MGIFDRFYYGKAGQRDYTEMDMPKNRIALFFQVLKDHLFDLIKVNALQMVFWIPFWIWTFMNLMVIQSIDEQALLASEGGAAQLGSVVGSYVMVWLIGCIPCLAITGPSSAGAAYIMRNWARDQHAFLFSDFKDAFKSNWKQALATSVLTAFVPAFAYTAIMFYSQASKQNVLMMIPQVLVISIVIIWIIASPLIYPLMVGYEFRYKHLLKNALIMACASLPRMAFSRFVTFVPVALLFMGVYVGNGILIMAVSVYYLLFGLAFSRLVYASVANGVFDKYLNPHIEGAQIGMGLRPKGIEDEIFDDDEDDDEPDDELDDEEA